MFDGKYRFLSSEEETDVMLILKVSS